MLKRPNPSFASTPSGVTWWPLAAKSLVPCLVLGLTGAACGSGGAEPTDGTPSTTGSYAPLVTAKCPPADLPVQPLGSGQMCGEGTSTDRYAKSQVTRDGHNYSFMANGWGPKFESHSVSWKGTSFTVENLMGSPGDRYEPAAYPAMYCGEYSATSLACGLPAAIDSLATLRTGWRWAANGNTSDYNVAYDIWLGDQTGKFSGYFMVWLRDPPGQQPAGGRTSQSGVAVANAPGVWDIWEGQVNGAPIINYVRAEGQDSPEIEFDVLDFIRDAQARGFQVPGVEILSVAVGFEIWEGPIVNLQSLDFYVDPKSN